MALTLCNPVPCGHQLTIVLSSVPIQNIQVTLKGNIIYVSGARTPDELQKRIEEESGLVPSEQGSVTFQGRVLDPDDSLSDAGLKDGDQINMVPEPMANHLKMIAKMGDGLQSLKDRTRSKRSMSPEDKQGLEVMEQLFHNMAKFPYMQEQMESFAQRLRDPATLARSADYDRVESLRVIILNNPLLLEYASESIDPDILRDPDSWYEHVQACVKRWATMDGYELWQSLLSNGLFGAGEDPTQ